MDELEDELRMSGMTVPSSMGLMEMRLMMVELTLRKEGRMPSNGPASATKPKPKQTKYLMQLLDSSLVWPHYLPS